MTEHDAGYKLLFSDPNITRSLLADFLPQEWQSLLDLGSLEKMSGSYVTDDLRSRHNDMIWRLRCGDDWLYLYLLLEFQSSVDRMMALRVTTYTCLLHQDLVRSEERSGDGYLPAVLPLVLYNGESRWHAPVELAKLIECSPPGFEHFQPNQQFLLIDESAFDTDELDPATSLAAGIFRFERHRTPPEVADVMKMMGAQLNRPEMAETHRTIVLWLGHRFEAWWPDQIMGKFTNLSEGYEMIRNTAREWQQQHHQAGLTEGLAQGMQQGMRQGMQQGIQQGMLRGVAQGMTQGEQTLLLRQLHRRFGELPEATRQRLEQASTDELETWADRVLDAKTLAEVFR